MEKTSNLTPADAREFLRWYVVYLADEKFAPFLYNDQDVRLWDAAHDEGRVVDALTEEKLSLSEAAMLRFLADRAGGWFSGTGGISCEPTFVPLTKWQAFRRELRALSSTPLGQKGSADE